MAGPHTGYVAKDDLLMLGPYLLSAQIIGVCHLIYVVLRLPGLCI